MVLKAVFGFFFSIFVVTTFEFFKRHRSQDLTQAFVQAFQDMKSVSAMRFISSILFVVIFFTIQYAVPTSINPRNTVLYKAIGMAVAALGIAYLCLRKEISLRLFNPRGNSILFHYALYGFMLQLCAAFILEISKVILNRYYDNATVGLYQVYYISSVSIAQMVITSIVTVYFPTISRSRNKEVGADLRPAPTS